MTIITVKTGGIAADAVTDAKIADDVVGTEHLTANEVDTAALKADAVTGAEIADNAVNSEHYTDGSIDTAHLADNQVTLAKLAGGTDGNIISFDASGDPVAIATGSDGQVLTSTGAGSPPAFEALPGGGITSASQFRLSASFNGTADPISSNWEEVDTDGYGRLGTAVSQSSGIFTFPATGIWHIISTMTHVEGSAAYAYATNIIQTTANNSSYADAAVSYNEATGDGHYQTTSASFILDVTNTSNIKARIKTNPAHSSTTTMGDSDRNRTYVTFIRLGDT